LTVVSGAKVTVRRLHFKGGRATNQGAAIRVAGLLILESCIFSDNQTTTASATGGAIYYSGSGANALTIFGCTFYENKAGTSGLGGAVYRNGLGTFLFTGNVLYGNNSGLYISFRNPQTGQQLTSGFTSGGYNASDKSFSTVTVSSDKTLSDLSVDPDDFTPSHANLPVIASPPAGFPSVYFDGTDRETEGTASAPGAMPAAVE
jgi:hypothetical protein